MKNRPYPYYEVPRVSSVADMLRQKADSMPDAAAFRYRKGRDAVETKTYKEVYEDVRRTASWIGQTYGKGSHIAIIGENSYEWLNAFFAVLVSGNVAVPIDKELPSSEVAWLIDKADATKAFVSKTYLDLVDGIDGLETMTLKKLQEMAGTDCESYRFYEPEKDELACIFFTSGTSGRSKGVMLSHGNLASEIYGTTRLIHAEGNTSFSALPFHHTFGLNVAILAAYNVGVAIFLNKSLKRVKDDLLLAKPDVIFLVPMFVEVFYKQVMEGIKKSGREKQFKTGIRISNLLRKLGIDRRRVLFKEILDSFGGNLKQIICGGAYLDPLYVGEFRNFGIEIYNGYGTTECSPCVTINRNHFKKDGSAGQVLEEVQARISPEGEVQFKGPVTMLGYYKDPEGTEAVLKDGWYSTGDLGYLDPDGFLFLTGRMKNLIILSNGENISPEELENDFHMDPGVNEVLVYEEDHKIVAEIFPEEAFMGNTEYFDALMEKVNQGRPAYKQITRVKLRDTEFIKNTTKKIVRYKNIPQA